MQKRTVGSASLALKHDRYTYIQVHTGGEVYREGEDVAAIDNILHRLVVQLNFGGLEDDGEFSGAVWGYDLHTATCTSFRALAAHSLMHACEPQSCKLRSLQTCYSFCIPKRTASCPHGSSCGSKPAALSQSKCQATLDVGLHMQYTAWNTCRPNVSTPPKHGIA